MNSDNTKGCTSTLPIFSDLELVLDYLYPAIVEYIPL